MKQKDFAILPILIIITLLGIVWYLVFQNKQLKIGENSFVKTPKDAGMPCTQSAECESEYCVTKEINATEGICYDSNSGVPCFECYWTIEGSQKAEGRRQIPGGGETMDNPCCTQ